MKKHFKSIFFMTGVILSLSSCKKEEVPLNETTNLETSVDKEGFTDAELFDMVKALQIDNGAMSNTTILGKDYILIGNDIIVAKDEVVDRYNSSRAGKNGLGAKHHRTKKIFDAKKFGTLEVYGLTGTVKESGLSKKVQKALKAAIGSYNKVSGTALKFKLKFETGDNLIKKGIKADILVVNNSNEKEYKGKNAVKSGGEAEFPGTDGTPGFLISTFNLEHRTDSNLKRLMIHELGHAVGFRHTDWNSSLSCETALKKIEAVTDLGAIHVPGSPQFLAIKKGKVTKKQSEESIKAILNSVFTQCDYASTASDLSKSDKAAIKKLFPAAKKPKKK